MVKDKLKGIEHMFNDFCEFFAGKDFDLFILFLFYSYLLIFYLKNRFLMVIEAKKEGENAWMNEWMSQWTHEWIKLVWLEQT